MKTDINLSLQPCWIRQHGQLTEALGDYSISNKLSCAGSNVFHFLHLKLHSL